MDDRMLTIKEIARELGYCEKTVRKKFEQRQLPGAIQVGGKGCQVKMPVSAIKKLKELQ